MNNFLKRAITGILFVIVLFGAIFAHQYTFFALFLTITVIALNEFYSLVQNKNLKPQRILGTLTAVSLFSAAFLHSSSGFYKLYPIVGVLVFLIFICELYRKKEKPFDNIAYTLTGLIYIAVPFSLLNYIVFSSGMGIYLPSLLAAIFILIWSNDSFAYLFGVSFGKNRLFKRISPKKSWEGSIGGAISTIGIAIVISNYIEIISMIDWLAIATIIVITGSLGDLCESLLKRSLNIKDSGKILPGHGGILDRFDALLLAIPFIVVYMVFKC